VDALVAAGRIDVAMTVLDQTGYPGFGYEIGQGATTDWEEWTYRSSMESHDHAMFSGINASLYTALAGITPTTAGYATLHIGPQVPPTLTRAAATLDTVRGPVGSAWTRSGGTFTLDVTIPVNSTATVALPTFGGTPTAHATPGATRTGPTTFTVGSGHWHFTETLR
jgi:alpha-L-rhamnosidase